MLRARTHRRPRREFRKIATCDGRVMRGVRQLGPWGKVTGMEFTRSILEGIIDNLDFDALIGKIENDWFECKSQPYKLDNDSDKRELAKDVSSFANYQGGHILIGIKTKPSSMYFGDEVEKIRPFKQSLVDINQYYNIVRDWVYPDIEGINIRWVATKSEMGKGVVVISVPQQRESLKPFLIKRILDQKKQVEIVFGYAERKRDNSQPLSVIDLQRALRSGFNYENIMSERFNGLDSLIRGLINDNTSRASQEQFSELVKERIEEALDGQVKAE